MTVPQHRASGRTAQRSRHLPAPPDDKPPEPGLSQVPRTGGRLTKHVRDRLSQLEPRARGADACVLATLLVPVTPRLPPPRPSPVLLSG